MNEACVMLWVKGCCDEAICFVCVVTKRKRREDSYYFFLSRARYVQLAAVVLRIVTGDASRVLFEKVEDSCPVRNIQY